MTKVDNPDKPYMNIELDINSPFSYIDINI